ncbi:MAG: hypothetical protein R3C44_03060 [Chloroflexota bacterium]
MPNSKDVGKASMQQGVKPWALIIIIAPICLLAIISLYPQFSLNLNYLKLNRAFAKGSNSLAGEARSGFEGLIHTSPSANLSALRGRALSFSTQLGTEKQTLAWEELPGGAAEVRQWAHRAERAKDWNTARVGILCLPHWSRAMAITGTQLAQTLEELELPLDAEEAYQQGLTVKEGTVALKSNFLTRLGQLARQGENPDWQLANDMFDTAITSNEFIGMSDQIMCPYGSSRGVGTPRVSRASLAGLSLGRRATTE